MRDFRAIERVELVRLAEYMALMAANGVAMEVPEIPGVKIWLKIEPKIMLTPGAQMVTDFPAEVIG